MAKFFTDFSEYTPGQQPSDWTERWATASGAATVESTGVPGGGGAQALRVSLSSNVRYALSWDEVGTPSGDVEVLIKALHAHTGNVNASQYRPTLHGSGSAGTESGYYTGLNSQFKLLYLTAFKGGASSNLQTLVAGSANTQNVWYWLRIQRTGTTVRSRFWLDGEEEPEEWRASGTDGDLTSGWVGVGSGHSSGVVWYAQIGVGTGGDSAPSEMPPSGATDIEATTLLQLTASATISAPAPANIAAATYLELTSGLSLETPAHIAAAALLQLTATTGLNTQPYTLIQGAAILQLVATADVQQEHRVTAETLLQLVATANIAVDSATTIAAAALLQLVATAETATAHHVRPEALLQLVAITAVAQDHLVRGVALLQLVAHEGYTGPGTGIVVPGARFTPNTLREGDTFRVVLPWAGIEGVTGLAHVNSRTLRDDRTEQDLNLHISPLDQPNIPALAGGARPVAGADQQDYARKQARQGREIDRIERDRNR